MRRNSDSLFKFYKFYFCRIPGGGFSDFFFNVDSPKLQLLTVICPIIMSFDVSFRGYGGIDDEIICCLLMITILKICNHS